MAEFTVNAVVSLRPDPDLNSTASGTINPGDRVTEIIRLGSWVKVAVGARTGWVQAQDLKEIVGKTVKLHPEPLSASFELVTGTIEPLVALANWQKVRVVTADGTIREGWIDTTDHDVGPETPPPPPPPPPSDPTTSTTELKLGVNAVYLDAIMKAHQITGMDPAALAALIDAEADKIRTGPNRGQWDRNCLNPDSGAGGLTQFLSSTWISHAKNTRNLLNRTAREKGLLSAQNDVLNQAELLRLRFDPELSIVSGAEFGVTNLRILEDRELIPEGIGDDEKARYIYLAHHEGVFGAEQFLKKQNSPSFEKFKAQVGQARAAQMVQAAGGDVALAYRTWLNGYMDEKFSRRNFASREPGLLSSFRAAMRSLTSRVRRFRSPPSARTRIW